MTTTRTDADTAAELLAGVRRILADHQANLDEADRTVAWNGLDVCDDFLDLCTTLDLIRED